VHLQGSVVAAIVEAPRARPVYRVSIAETSWAAADMAFKKSLTGEILGSESFSPNYIALMLFVFGSFSVAIAHSP
jgi:hypothetical protein